MNALLESLPWLVAALVTGATPRTGSETFALMPDAPKRESGPPPISIPESLPPVWGQLVKAALFAEVPANGRFTIAVGFESEDGCSISIFDESWSYERLSAAAARLDPPSAPCRFAVLRGDTTAKAALPAFRAARAAVLLLQRELPRRELLIALLEGAFVLVHDGARPDIELTASGTGESGLLRVGTRVWGFDSSGVSTATVASSFDPSGVVAADWRDEYGRAIALEGRTASGGRAWRVRPADPVEQAGLVRVDGELSSGLREKTRITTSGPCYLSPRSAAALFRVHRAFRQRGLAARLLTCYRPLSTGGPSPSEPAHAHGAAIDIESGAGMPEIDSMPRCRGAAGHGSLDPLMVRVLAAAGFRPVSGWHLHFEGPDARSAPLIGVPIPDHR